MKIAAKWARRILSVKLLLSDGRRDLWAANRVWFQISNGLGEEPVKRDFDLDTLWSRALSFAYVHHTIRTTWFHRVGHDDGYEFRLPLF
ncbi:MAG: hypothetical protein ACI8TQ_002719 [Planctomycetota bacterium]|jgi:hypothetical protein